MINVISSINSKDKYRCTIKIERIGKITYKSFTGNDLNYIYESLIKFQNTLDKFSNTKYQIYEAQSHKGN